MLGSGTRAIIIGSELDGVFCAGADLKERNDMTRQQYGFSDPSYKSNEHTTVDNCSSESLLTRQSGQMTFLDDSAAPSP